MPEATRRVLRALLIVVAGAAALWLTLRFLLPWLAPFLLALALASLMEPAVRALTRQGWRRGLAAALLTLLLLAVVLWAALRLGSRCVTGVSALIRELPGLMRALAEGAAAGEERLLRAADAAPPEVKGYLEAVLGSLGETLTALPLQLSQRLPGLLTKAAQSGPDVLLFAVTAGLGTYFLSASYPGTLAFLRSQLPDRLQRRLRDLGRDLKGSFGGLLRAQLMLMGLTFLELLLAFLLMGLPGAPGLAAVTALVDALPVFGVGTVLLPWAAASFLLGNGARALSLASAWAGINLVRNCLQAKLLGDQIGLSPLASLLAVYVGWRICGVGGMLLFPVLLSTLQQLNDRGLVKLWQSE